MLIFPSPGHGLVAILAVCGTAACLKALDIAGRVRWSARMRKRRILRDAALSSAAAWGLDLLLLAVLRAAGTAIVDPVRDAAALVVMSLGTLAAFLVLNRRGGRERLALAAAIYGAGLVAMHALLLGASGGANSEGIVPPYAWGDLAPWATSAVVAVLGGGVSLWLAFRQSERPSRIAAGLFLALTVVAIQYVWLRVGLSGLDTGDPDANPALSLGFLIASLVILSAAAISNMLDRRFAALAEREAASLRRSEERIRSRYRLTPMPLHALTVDGTVDKVSDTWLDLLEYPREAVIGRPLTDFMTEEARAAGDLDWGRLCVSGDVLEVTTRFVTRSGAVLDVIVTLRRETDAVGRMTGALGGLVDITARKRAEAALRQAQKIEAVGQLTGGVAHDFNNLLAVVMGNLEMLAKRLPDDPRMRRQLESALQATQRGSSLTQRMLSFARRQDLNPQPVDLVQVVRGMDSLLRNAVGSEIAIVHEMVDGLPPAMVDANQLELSLINLAVNARDAMPEGGTLTVRGRAVVLSAPSPDGIRPGRYVVLSVSDTGSGMDETTLMRAREPFFTTKGVGKGTGLGLSMVHGLAEQSGGGLTLASAPDRGTVAEIYLPEAEGVVLAAPAPVEIGEAGPRDRLRVLLVDDDVLVRASVTELLEDLGHAVVQVGSGAEGLTAFQADPGFDVIITDHAMPQMTGVQFAAAIREIVPLQPIILASGYAEIPEGTRLNLPRLRKPYHQAALARILSETVPPGRNPSIPAGLVVPFRPRQIL